jgi:hypothetical protein
MWERDEDEEKCEQEGNQLFVANLFSLNKLSNSNECLMADNS